MSEFRQGLAVAYDFYDRDVKPLLTGVPHAAGRLDEGSDTIGLDTPMSADHDWGEHRLQVFLADGPSKQVCGIPTTTVREFLSSYLGYDLDHDLEPKHWLTFSEQRLLTIRSGTLFADDIGLAEIRRQLHYYPQDVWFYQLASVWQRIGQEEHLVGRAGHAGDELGARLIAARLVKDIMRLAFLYEKTYAPYPKWFGTAFNNLNSAPSLHTLLQAVVRTENWKDRDAALAECYTAVAQLHNRSGITEPLTEKTKPFFDRPFSVIHLHGEHARRISELIVDPMVRAIADKGLIGSVDLFSDSTDLITHRAWLEALRNLYD